MVKDCIKRAQIILSDEEELDFAIVKAAGSYDEALDFLTKKPLTSGIYFLDIEIGKKLDEQNGLDLGEIIKKQDPKAQLIFVTSHQDMAFLTFQRRLGASNFIVKNGNADDLRRNVTYSLEQAVDAIAKYRYIQKNTFSYRFGHDVRNMSMGDVVYVETTPVPHKLRLVKTTGWAEFIGKLKELPQKYPALVQVSESCVINPANVKEVDLKEKKLTFITGDIRYFSTRNSRKVRQLFQER